MANFVCSKTRVTTKPNDPLQSVMSKSDNQSDSVEITFPDDSFVICISRSQCSGGVTFAHLLAEKLGVPVYDDSLFDFAAKDHNIRQDLFERNEDSTDFSVPIIYGSEYSSGSMITYTDNYLSNKNIYSMQAETIVSLACKGSAVFVGHTADFTLRDHPHRLSIYISEPMKVRIRNLQHDYEGVSDAEAEDRLLKLDKDRRQYYNYYTGGRWGRCETYDLSIRPSFFGMDYATDLVTEIIRGRDFPLKGTSLDDEPLS